VIWPAGLPAAATHIVFEGNFGLYVKVKRKELEEEKHAVFMGASYLNRIWIQDNLSLSS